ncbi:hypothetical protein BGI41_06865 [Methanobrevibacter sp. 87.7]|uniref:glycosyltransferase family 2 protein n=1 Tax=Methanobrevibacter sp. 87.7 TaxID=387957 RepID=UPI000B65156D|nr:glycosyltransferase family 2 protein [Methanobrevibacter sp. 87.7]OWT32591.1 hypothetical protein BGI41_06865 [Methanobrevibacter sp. 87.7]
MYKISVIIPVYNSEKYLNHCIDSVINQTIGFENIELILIDDKSTDNSTKIMKTYEDKYKNIKCTYLNKNNGCPGPVRNIALDKATGKYIMFLDCDDYYKNNYCEVMFNAINKTEFNVVVSKYDNKLFNSKDINLTEVIINPLENKTLLQDTYMWNKIYKREFINKYNIKCPNLLYNEDVYFNLQSYFHSGNIKFLPKYYGYKHIIREDNEKSLSYKVKESDLTNIIESLKFNIDYMKKFDYDYVISSVLSSMFIPVFILILQSKIPMKKSINYISKITDYANVKLKFDEKWAQIFYKNSLKKRYLVIKLLSKLFNIYFNSSFLKNLHRN